MQKKKSKAVTLIELVMVIATVGVVVAAGSMYTKETIDLWRFMSFRNELVSEARLAVMRMTREIRRIKDAASISAFEVSRLTFSTIESSPSTIEYKLVGGNLMRNNDILASGVNSMVFNYYKKDNSAAVLAADIHRISIALQIRSGDQVKNLSMQIFPRNLN